MISFSQRDPRWAAEPIPGTNMTIGRFGCVITGIATMAQYFGQELTPLDVSKLYRFTSGGLLYWGSYQSPIYKWERREHGRNDTAIQAALDDPLAAVILQVAGGSHWVLGLGLDKKSGLIVIADPWLGDFTTMSRYADSITGASYFRRK